MITQTQNINRLNAVHLICTISETHKLYLWILCHWPPCLCYWTWLRIDQWHQTTSCWSCTFPTRAKAITVTVLRPSLLKIQPWHKLTEAEKSRSNSIQHNRVHFMTVQVETKYIMHSHITGNGGVSGHWLGWEVIVTVGAVEERLSPLAVDKIGLQNEAWARAGHWVQWAATWWRSIVHIKTANGEKQNGTKVRIWKCAVDIVLL